MTSKFLTSIACAKEEDLADVVIDSGPSAPPEGVAAHAVELPLFRARRSRRLRNACLPSRSCATAHHRANRRSCAPRPHVRPHGHLDPLGPGICCPRPGTDRRARSLLIGVAFDTTVAGLITAGVAYVVGRIRGNWYENYLGALEAAMCTILEKIEKEREAGVVTTVGRWRRRRGHYHPRREGNER